MDNNNYNKKMRSPIKYFGGKIYMYDELKKHFPKDFEELVFIDGFGGGGSVLFSKEPIGVEIYNDLDQNLYNLFKVLSDKRLFMEFKEKLDLLPYSRDFRSEFKKKLKEEYDKLSEVERAVFYFYLNRTSYNGNGSFVTSINSRRNMSKSVSDYLSMVDYLPEIHQRISRVIIERLDICELLKKYNCEKIFFYLDPPYVWSSRKSKARYCCDMTDDQHKEMLNIILNHKAKFLISGYDNSIYNILTENGWKKYQFKSPLSDSVETIWYNYDVKKEKEFLKIELPKKEKQKELFV